LLNLEADCNKPSKPNSGGINKIYRTNSYLLLQVKEVAGVSRKATELEIIVESINAALEKLVSNEASEFVHLRFSPTGCIWNAEFTTEKDMNDAACSFRLEIILSANEMSGVMNYLVDTLMICKNENIDNSRGAPASSQPGYKKAKAAFEILALCVRKAIVRLEFPEFLEGCKGRPFKEVYQLNARLKSGSFATVCRGTHRATGRKVAIKCVLRKDLPAADDAAIFDEVAILASLNHPHIVPLIDFFDEKDCYFIVMELMSGGDLFDRIGKKKAYSEADARDLILKMLEAVAYCHSRKIAHCDMKPKNLLLMSDENDKFIKLADFGFAARVHQSKSLTKQCGTPFFVSPEILMRKPYDQKSDMWSIGCIIFLLLAGNLPFMGRSQKELFRKIVSGKYEFAAEDWANVSEDAKDLVRRLLVLNPDERMTANEAVRHKWLCDSRHHLSMNDLQCASQRLKTFNARMKLRSAMIALDWVSSLKRMSWMSNRSLVNSVDGTTASCSSGSSRSSNGSALFAVDEKEEKTCAVKKGISSMSLKCSKE